MDDYFLEWDDPLLEPYYLSCIIDEQALEGEGEWKKFYYANRYDSGVYRIKCEYPKEDPDGVKHYVIYIGETGDEWQGGLGHRIACYISVPHDPSSRPWGNVSTNKRVRKIVHTLVKEKKHGQIILECLPTDNCKWIEAVLLDNYQKNHDSLPVGNEQGANPSSFDVKDPKCKLYRLVDNWRKDS